MSLTQAAYRVCTAIEGKTNSIIVDFVDRHHRKLMGHSESRMAVYQKIPTFDVRPLQSPNEFVEWLSAGAN